MHSIARASAFLQGPRVIETSNGKKIIAVWNTPDELRRIYGREGFKISDNQHEAKVMTWADSFGDCGYIGGGVYYDISLNTALIAQCEKMAIAEGTDTILGV
jgi:hypothetical protein